MTFSEAKTWPEAHQHCADLGRRLVEAKTQAEFSKAHEVRVQLGGTRGEMWLGGKDFQEDGSYVWISNGEPISLDDQFWLTAQPSNTDSEFCINLVFAGMNDLSCHSTQLYACEL